MKTTPLAIPSVVLIEPKVFEADRGFFFESFHQASTKPLSANRLPSCRTTLAYYTAYTQKSSNPNW